MKPVRRPPRRPPCRPARRAQWATAAATAVLLLASVGPARSREAVRFTATLNGRDAASIDANRPLQLRSDQLLEVTMVVTNDGDRDVVVRSVRLESKVVGLTFFSYESRLDMTVAPGSTEQRRFPLETLGLSDQATGLLPAGLALLDRDRDVVATLDFPAEVDGSVLSVYSVFGILVLAITGVLLAAIMVRLAAHRLSPNRWSRGVRFGTAGVGVGLALTFSLSALGVLLPAASRWLPLVLISAGLMFAAGYLTPSTYSSHIDDEDHMDERELEGTDSRSSR